MIGIVDQHQGTPDPFENAALERQPTLTEALECGCLCE